jgi:hypothetical protein
MQSIGKDVAATSHGLFLFRSCLAVRTNLGVLAAEALDPARGIHQLLFTGEKRVATGADFHVDVALVGGAGSKGATARAMHVDFVVCRMNGCFHGFSKALC